jgi:hypothetical protein
MQYASFRSDKFSKSAKPAKRPGKPSPADLVFCIPSTKPYCGLDGEETNDVNDVCLLCGHWAASRAMCSNRYSYMEGCFEDDRAAPGLCYGPRHPKIWDPEDAQWEDCIPENFIICDRCLHKELFEAEYHSGPGESTPIRMLGVCFLVDQRQRVND